MDDNQKQKNWALPVSIVIAGVIIAGSLYYSNISKSNPNNNRQKDVAAGLDATKGRLEINGPQNITADDHTLGNPNAELTMIIFTDTECPFCKNFHATLKQLIEDYGKSGKIFFVLRHFPLDSLHSKSRKEAEATECAADIGGNEKFWQYLDRIFEITTSNDTLDPAQLPKIAEYIGLDVGKFNECLQSGKFKDKVERNVQDAINSGGQGTPYSIIINKKGEKFPITGAYPYNQIKLIIEQILNGESPKTQ